LELKIKNISEFSESMSAQQIIQHGTRNFVLHGTCFMPGKAEAVLSLHITESILRKGE
jgi:hypothetical protein